MWRPFTRLRDDLVCGTPDVCETNGRVEPAEKTERSRDVCDDTPQQGSVEFTCGRTDVGSQSLEQRHPPEGYIDDDEEGDALAPRFIASPSAPLRTMQQTADEHRLEGRLKDNDGTGEKEEHS